MTPNFFGPGSPYPGHPLLTPERTAAEVDVIMAYLDDREADGLHVLDVGCGFGRHAIEFACRGATVFAVDPSAHMIEVAKQRAAAGLGQRASAISWVEQAGESVEGTDLYDLGLCLFTTLGQVSAVNTTGAPALLDTMVRAVRPGGSIIVEVPERERALDLLVADETLPGPGEGTHVTRRFDDATGILHERFEQRGSGQGETFDLAYRLFRRAELIEMFADAGFEDIGIIDSALVPPPPTFVTVVATCPSG